MAKKARNRSEKRRNAKKRRKWRARQSVRNRSPRFPAFSPLGDPLDTYEQLLLRVRAGLIDPRLKLVCDPRGPGGRYSWLYDSVSYDHENDEWRPTPKDRGAQMRRDNRDCESRGRASYANPQWVHSREERYRIDYLGTPYALRRIEGRCWEVVYFPNDESRNRALAGLACVGDCVSLPLRAEKPTLLRRMLEKHIAQGKDPAVWDIDPARSARIGKPRKPLQGLPLVSDKYSGYLALFDAEKSFSNIARAAFNIGHDARQSVAFTLSGL